MNYNSKKVLIVEDDVLLSVVEKRLVEKMGHEVVATTDNGKTALKVIHEKPPDIVLMDVKLNGAWDGIETARQIKKEFSIPIIYLSGCSDLESRSRADEVGFSGFLVKPIQMEDLQKAFNAVFESKNLGKSSTDGMQDSRQQVSL